MTPSDIEILLHYYISREAHPRITAPAVSGGLAMFVRQGILELAKEKNNFDVTEQGAVLVEMLCDTPFPIAHTTWTDPRNV